MIRVFYHNDPDGILSGAIVNVAVLPLERPMQFYPCDYGMEFPWDDIEPDDDVYMVDFSLPPNDLVKLSLMSNFVWIDHHATSINAWDEAMRNSSLEVKDIPGLRRIGLAGCQLTLEYFGLQINNLKSYPSLVDLIGTYDVWDKNRPMVPWEMATKAFYAFLANNWSPYSEELVNYLNYACCRLGGEKSAIGEAMVKKIIDDGVVVEKYLKNYLNPKFQERTFDFDWEGLHWLCINSPLKGSDQIVGKFDLTKYDGMICYFFDGEFFSYGLYTEHKTPKKSFAELAERHAYGDGASGGGHHRAARFTSTKNIFEELIPQL